MLILTVIVQFSLIFKFKLTVLILKNYGCNITEMTNDTD